MRWFIVLTLACVFVNCARAADTQNGSRLYGQYCLSCHGANGKGNFPGVPDFSRNNVMFRSDGALFSSIKTGKGSMPGFLGILRERELFDVIAYMRTMI
jgi:cytochrome c6